MDRLVQARRNSSALAMELRRSCTNPSIYRVGGKINNHTKQIGNLMLQAEIHF